MSAKDLSGEALIARAVQLGIEVAAFRDADGATREKELRWKVQEYERFTREFHFGTLLVACIAAFVFCGIAAWAAIHFLWHTL